MLINRDSTEILMNCQKEFFGRGKNENIFSTEASFMANKDNNKAEFSENLSTDHINIKIEENKSSIETIHNKPDDFIINHKPEIQIVSNLEVNKCGIIIENPFNIDTKQKIISPFKKNNKRFTLHKLCTNYHEKNNGGILTRLEIKDKGKLLIPTNEKILNGVQEKITANILERTQEIQEKIIMPSEKNQEKIIENTQVKVLGAEIEKNQSKVCENLQQKLQADTEKTQEKAIVVTENMIVPG